MMADQHESLKAALKEVLPDLLKDGLAEAFISIGIAAKDDTAKVAMQQDMAFLRSLRLKVGVLATAAATGLGSGLITAWEWFQTHFGGAAPPHH
jgi:uncharacterized protein YegL